MAVAPKLLPDESSDNETIACISGLAAPFEQWSHDLEERRLTEKIVKGAFDKTIRLVKEGKKIVGLQVDHDPKRTVTDTNPNTAGRLELQARDDGLYFIADLPNTALGRWIQARITMNEIFGVSIGFQKQGKTANITQRKLYANPTAIPAPQQDLDDDDLDGSDVVEGVSDVDSGDKFQVVKTVDLREISLISSGKPAYGKTFVKLEDRADQQRRLRQLALVYDVLS